MKNTAVNAPAAMPSSKLSLPPERRVATSANSSAPAPSDSGAAVSCAPVVAREARAQGKPVASHHAHLLVHGLLHLQGFDHERAADARRMEARERSILARLGFPDPY